MALGDVIVTTQHCLGNTRLLWLCFVHQSRCSTFVTHKRLHYDFLSHPTRMVSSQGEKGPEARHLGNTRTGKAESVADSGGRLSIFCHTCFPPSRCSLQGHTLLPLQPIWPAVFLWCLFIASRIPRAAGGGCCKQHRPGAALQSGRLHYCSHAVCRSLLCSLPGTKFSWRFSSVISLFTEPWPWTSCLYLICTCPHGP